MASPERVVSWVDFNSPNNASKTSQELSYHDENTPLSPGEVKIMRNQSKTTSRLLSASRKAKTFSVHGDSPQSAGKLGKPALDSQERRKTLQVLQPSANGNGILVGSTVVRKEKLQSKEKKKSKSKQTKITLHTSGEESNCTDSDSSDSDTHSKSSVTEKSEDASKQPISDEAFALMVQDPAPENYWQLLAEERRLALQETLEENEKLCKQLEEMKERCSKLEEVAGQAEYFASLYAMVMEGDNAVLDSSEDDYDETVTSSQQTK